MRVQPDNGLVRAAEVVQQALIHCDGLPPEEGARHLRAALGKARNALQKHEPPAPPGDDPGDVDRIRPTLDRQAQALEAGKECLEEQAGILKVWSLDVRQLRQEAEAFLEGLRRQEQGEANLIQESVTTDLGAGD